MYIRLLFAGLLSRGLAVKHASGVGPFNYNYYVLSGYDRFLFIRPYTYLPRSIVDAWIFFHMLFLGAAVHIVSGGNRFPTC